MGFPPIQQANQITASHLFAGHGLLDRRQAQDPAQNGRHHAVAGKGLIVEDIEKEKPGSAYGALVADDVATRRSVPNDCRAWGAWLSTGDVRALY